MDRLVVLQADHLHDFGVGHQLPSHAGRKRSRVGFRIVDCLLDLNRPEVRTREALDRATLFGQRAAVDVQPPAVAETFRLDDERIAFPLADGVAIEPGLRIVFGYGSPVSEDLTDALMRFVEQQHDAWALNDLARE